MEYLLQQRYDDLLCGLLGGRLEASALSRATGPTQGGDPGQIRLHGLRQGAKGLVARETDAAVVQHPLGQPSPLRQIATSTRRRAGVAIACRAMNSRVDAEIIWRDRGFPAAEAKRARSERERRCVD